MIKYASVLIIASLLVGAVFFVTPALLLNMVPDCTVDTTFIDVNDNVTVIARGNWFHRTTGNESIGSYHGQIIWLKPDGKKTTQIASFSYETYNKIVGRAIRSTTHTFVTNHDNTAKADDIYKYVYKGVKKDTMGLYRLLRINDQFFATSLPHGLPRAICNKVR